MVRPGKKRKTHLTLLFWVFLMLFGSAVWLKFTLAGDTTGHPASKPLWLRTYDNIHSGGGYIIEDLTLTPDYGTCEYKEPADEGPGVPLADTKTCGLENAMMPVTATIGKVNENMDGLFLTILASKDFKNWWQANHVMMPRDMFHLDNITITNAQRSELKDSFDKAALDADEDNPTGADGTVLMKDLIEPLETMFDGAGAIEISDERVAGAMTAAKLADGENCSAPCFLSFDQYYNAYASLRQRYTPNRVVKTSVCVGRPGFTYLVGCVTSGVVSSKAYGAKCARPPCKGISGPPFQGCRAIATSCGPTCDSDAVEPRKRQKRNPKLYCNTTSNEIDHDDIEARRPAPAPLSHAHAVPPPPPLPPSHPLTSRPPPSPHPPSLLPVTQPPAHHTAAPSPRPYRSIPLPSPP